MQNECPHCGQVMWAKLDKVVVVDGQIRRLTARYKVVDRFGEKTVCYEDWELSPPPPMPLSAEDRFKLAHSDEDIARLTGRDIDEVRKIRGNPYTARELGG